MDEKEKYQISTDEIPEDLIENEIESEVIEDE